MRFTKWILSAILALPLLAFGKGETTLITLNGSGMNLEIRDPESLGKFAFGPGPGNIPTWQPRSWIVEDWKHPVTEPAASMPRLKVIFRIGSPGSAEGREYVVHYAFDFASRQGYVYLPGEGEAHHRENINLMARGAQYEGHWFRALPEWAARVQSAIEAPRK